MKKRSANRCGEPKKARSNRKAPSKCSTEDEEEEEEIVNVFSHDMDTLECDICFLPFESEVYSCKNGHAACANCCVNRDRKCPTCNGNEPIGDFRCRATEKILAGMTRPCRFKKHGCRETVRYTEARSHEEDACRFAPYSCPFDGCAYHGLMLHDHIQDAHAREGGVTSAMGLLRPMTVTLQKAAPFRVLLHRDGDSVFLLLNGGDVLTGRSLSVVCVCPYPLQEDEGEEIEMKYEMAVKGDETASLSLTATGTVQFVRRMQEYKAKEFLFVPDHFWGSSGSVTVTVHLDRQLQPCFAL